MNQRLLILPLPIARTLEQECNGYGLVGMDPQYSSDYTAVVLVFPDEAELDGKRGSIGPRSNLCANFG